MHLDATFRGWSSTLAARVRLVISRLVLIFALSLDSHGRVRLVRSMFLPAALHGIEASLLASDSLRKLRYSIHRVVWSRRQLLATVGAVLSLLDGPTGCDPAFCVIWFRFRLLRRYLALCPTEVGRFTVMLLLLARDLLVFSRLSIVFGLLLVWISLKIDSSLWVSDSVFSAGVVVGRWKLGILLLLILRKFLLVPLILIFISLSLMSSSLSVRLTGGSWIGCVKQSRAAGLVPQCLF